MRRAYVMPPRRPMTASPIQQTEEQHHAAAIRYHMDEARACRAVLDRIKDNDHDRRRATVRQMQHHVQQARAHSRAIIATRKEANQ